MKLLATLAFFGMALFSSAADSSYSGSVRAADQFVPGATITATQGSTKVIGYSDDSGRFELQLGPGAWSIHVDMFGFTPRDETVTLAGKPLYKDWTLDMPRLSQPPAPVTKKPDQTDSSRPRPNSSRGIAMGRMEDLMAKIGMAQITRGRSLVFKMPRSVPPTIATRL